jgi:hypothetical protein
VLAALRRVTRVQGVEPEEDAREAAKSWSQPPQQPPSPPQQQQQQRRRRQGGDTETDDEEHTGADVFLRLFSTSREAKRLALKRRSEQVGEQLDLFWFSLCFPPGVPPPPSPAVRAAALFLRCCKALFHPSAWDEAEVRAALAHDLDQDCALAGNAAHPAGLVLLQTRFRAMLFEVLDLWTEGASAAEYCHLAELLYERVFAVSSVLVVASAASDEDSDDEDEDEGRRGGGGGVREVWQKRIEMRPLAEVQSLNCASEQERYMWVLPKANIAAAARDGLGDRTATDRGGVGGVGVGEGGEEGAGVIRNGARNQLMRRHALAQRRKALAQRRKMREEERERGGGGEATVSAEPDLPASPLPSPSPAAAPLPHLSPPLPPQPVLSPPPLRPLSPTLPPQRPRALPSMGTAGASALDAAYARSREEYLQPMPWPVTLRGHRQAGLRAAGGPVDGRMRRLRQQAVGGSEVPRDPLHPYWHGGSALDRTPGLTPALRAPRPPLPDSPEGQLLHDSRQARGQRLAGGDGGDDGSGGGDLALLGASAPAADWRGVEVVLPAHDVPWWDADPVLSLHDDAAAGSEHALGARPEQPRQQQRARRQARGRRRGEANVSVEGPTALQMLQNLDAGSGLGSGSGAAQSPQRRVLAFSRAVADATRGGGGVAAQGILYATQQLDAVAGRALALGALDAPPQPFAEAALRRRQEQEEEFVRSAALLGQFGGTRNYALQAMRKGRLPLPPPPPQLQQQQQQQQQQQSRRRRRKPAAHLQAKRDWKQRLADEGFEVPPAVAKKPLPPIAFTTTASIVTFDSVALNA